MEWQTELQWIARILLNRGAAEGLEEQNGEIGGNNVSVLNVIDSGVSEALTPSNAADFLTSLGLSYSNKLQRQPSERGVTRAITDTTKLYLIDTDVLVVVRTDKTAGGGGAAGLPTGLSAYRGVMVIVDDPDTVAAAETALRLGGSIPVAD